jgi:hypothetical protein
MSSSTRPTAASYKAACSRPNVLPRPVVEQTATALGKAARAESVLVRTQLWSPILEKPPLHEGGTDTDRLVLGLTPQQVKDVYLALLAEMLRCEIEGEEHAHERHHLHSLYAHWEDYWFSLGAP